MRAMAAMGLMLMIGGCGGGGDEEAAANAANAVNAVPEMARGPMLGGVDLSGAVMGRGQGGWSLRIAPGYIGLVEREGAEPAQFYFVAPDVADGSATYGTKNIPGDPVTITLKAEACTLAGAAKPYPLTLTLKVGDRTRSGCAAQGE